MIALAKFVHIAAIAIWAAGVVSLPGLYVQRAHVRSRDELLQLQRIVRFAYVAIVSPAAFIAIASGTGLIFLTRTFEAWFSLKLAFVATLTMLHVLTGLVIIRLFRDGEIYPVWRFVLATVVSSVVVVAILFLVLAKPVMDFSFLDVMNEPGGLQRLYRDFSPWQTP